MKYGNPLVFLLSFATLFFMFSPIPASAQTTPYPCTDSIGCIFFSSTYTSGGYTGGSYAPSGSGYTYSYPISQNENQAGTVSVAGGGEITMVLTGTYTFQINTVNNHTVTGSTMITGPGIFGASPAFYTNLPSVIEVPIASLTQISAPNPSCESSQFGLCADPDPTNPSTAIDLTWTNTYSPGVKYLVCQATAGTLSSTAFTNCTNPIETFNGSSVPSKGLQMSFINGSLAPSTAYYYKVIANVGSQYFPSGVVSLATTAAPPPTPTGPTNLVATITGTSTISLSWTKAQNDPNLAGYIVYRSTNENMSSAAVINNPGLTTGTTFTDRTAVPATPYYYQVNSYASTAPGGVEPNAASNVAGAEITVQNIIVVSYYPLTPVSSAIGLTWNSPSYDDAPVTYSIYRTTITEDGFPVFGAGNKIADTNATNYGDTKLNPGTTYYYEIQGIYNDNEDGLIGTLTPFSHFVSFTTASSTPPSNLIATIVLTPHVGVQLTWTNNEADSIGTDIQGYASLFPFAPVSIGDVPAGSTTYFYDLTASTSPWAHHLNINADVYTVRSELPDGSYTQGADKKNAVVPHCFLISGNPNASDRIVFERGDGVTLDNFISAVNKIITSGFSSVDPFKQYISQFSFDADPNPYPQNSLTKSSNNPLIYSNGSSAQIADASDCAPDYWTASFTSKPRVEQIFLFDDPSMYSAWDESIGSGNIFENLDPYVTMSNNSAPVENPGTSLGTLSIEAIHETGHAMGGLNDEYYTPGTFNSVVAPYLGRNCTVNQQIDFKDTLDGLIYGGYDMAPATTTGCGNLQGPAVGSSYYRPSYNSIMGGNYPVTGQAAGTAYLPQNDILPFWNQFNVISCGYLVAAILGEPIDHAHAQLHWPVIDTDPAVPTIFGLNPPGCSSPSMNTTKDGIPTVDPIAPGAVQRISVSSVTPGTPPNTITP